MRNKSTKIAAAALSAALVLASPATALAQETITKTYTYTATAVDASQVPQTIDQDGQWKLSGTTVNSVPAKETTKVEHTDTVECWPEDLAATKASFAAEKEVTENGITATVKLGDVTETPVYRDREVALNVTQTWTGLPSNDVSQIPQTWSGVTDGSPNYVTLGLAGVSWQVGSVDEFGMPKTYNCMAVYRGTDTYSVLDHYEVTANYAFDGERDAADGSKVFTVTATYEQQPQDAEIPWVPIAGGAAAAAAALFGGLWWFRSRARVIEAGAEGQKLVARVPVRKDGSGIRVELSGIAAAEGNSLWLELPKKHAASGASLVVTMDGKTAYTGAARERIRL